jgi:hypothetical protein
VMSLHLVYDSLATYDVVANANRREDILQLERG